ncbi:hypothetical protein [Catenulispora subtropica]|uniref:Lipoprotein n=1 Tax=Catenulispora subtropica TaxID=450798 RepID=A0ABN2SWL9_9ACTN
MRKRTLATAAVAACGLALGIAGPAGASTGGVLTVGSAGGTDVNVGDTLTGAISSNFVFTTSGGKITCTTGQFTATDSTNGPVGGTATESISQLHADAANCTTTISGTTKVVSVEINGAATGTVTDGASPTLHVTGLDEKVTLRSILGTNVVCDFGTTGSVTEIDGALSNTTNGATFTNQPVNKITGSSLCPANGTFSGGIGPIKDTTQASQNTFVN